MEKINLNVENRSFEIKISSDQTTEDRKKFVFDLITKVKSDEMRIGHFVGCLNANDILWEELETKTVEAWAPKDTKIVFMNEFGEFLKVRNDIPDRFTPCKFWASNFNKKLVSDARERVKKHTGKFVKIDISNVVPVDVEQEKDGIFFS